MIPDKNISLAGKVVSRLGLGTMRLTGPGLWGPPIDSPAAIHLLRKAVHHHGINHIDTADSYGPGISELLIHEALHPYPKHLLIATKVGLTRSGPGKWSRDGRPEYLKRAVKSSLRRLSLEYMDLCYLHRIDPHIPFSDQLGALIELQTQGLIAHIGLSKVDSTHIEYASKLTTISAVQNRLNKRDQEDLNIALKYCGTKNIPYVAFAPLGGETSATPQRVTSMEWVLAQGNHVAVVPSTTNTRHLQELAATFERHCSTEHAQESF